MLGGASPPLGLRRTLPAPALHCPAPAVPLAACTPRLPLRAAAAGRAAQPNSCHARPPHAPMGTAARRRARAAANAASTDTAIAAADAAAADRHVAPPDLPGMQPGGSYDAAANAAYWATRPVPVIARCLVIAAELGRCGPPGALARGLTCPDCMARDQLPTSQTEGGAAAAEVATALLRSRPRARSCTDCLRSARPPTTSRPPRSRADLTPMAGGPRRRSCLAATSGGRRRWRARAWCGWGPRL